MPCTYRIESGLNLVIKVYWGRVRYTDVLNMLDAMEDDPVFRDGMMELDDLSDVTDLDISKAEVSRFADLIKGLSTRRRRPTKKAVVTRSDAVRMAARNFTEDVGEGAMLRVGVFDSIDDALAFLGVPAAAVNPDTPIRPLRPH